MRQLTRLARFFALPIAVLIASLGAGLSSLSSSAVASSGAKTTAHAAKTYSVYLDINGTFNSWRTQMEHIVEYAAGHPPLGGKTDFHFVDSSQDLSGQASDLNNIIASHPDAILLDAASSTGLNSAVQRACQAGILVVSFDNVVSAPCAYKLTLPQFQNGEVLGAWVGQVLHGKGQVIVDQGEVGATVADETYLGYLAGLKKYPGIKIVGKIASQFTPGLVKSQVAPIIAAHPQVKAVLTAAFYDQALQAFDAAHLKPIALTGETTTNADVKGCDSQGIQCAAASVPPYLGADALQLAVGLLNGSLKEKSKTILINTPTLMNHPVKVKGFPSVVIDKMLPIAGVGSGATLPIAPPWLKISAKQAVNG